jgi:NAD(P)-dependent dehydrogenase (short-subunit alcohol dehydrogenase family)
MSLAGRVALVTGAGRRVGRAIALRLARARCDVAVHYNRSQKEAIETIATSRGLGVRAECYAADLASHAACRALVQQVHAAFGRLDVLINNASVFEPQSLDDFSIDAWERDFAVHVTAPMVLAHEARAALRASGGRIVNLCDAATARPWPTHLSYSVSKGALETLTRVLARAFAPEVNVVGIAPGVAEWPEAYDEALRAKLTERIPLKRAGTAEDIASAVHFVLADGDYITGAIIPVDGGRQLC